MLDFRKSLRRGGLIAAAAVAVALGGAAAAQAGGHHHHHHHHGHHHHGHHHHHGLWNYGFFYTGGYGRCGAWRKICASRWGFGTYNYGVCLWRHGC